MGKWKNIKNEFIDRFKEPWSEPKFVLYFFGVLIFIGSFGIIATIIETGLSGTKSWVNVSKSMGTYFFAVIGTAFVDFNLNKDLRKSDYHDTFSLIGFLIFFLCIGLQFWLFMVNNYWSFLPAGLGFILALTTWVFVHCKDPNYKQESVSKSDATGGDPETDLNGNLNEFES